MCDVTGPIYSGYIYPFRSNQENMRFAFCPVDGAVGHLQRCCEALLHKILKKVMREIFCHGCIIPISTIRNFVYAFGFAVN